MRALALLLLACTPAPDCETACGLVLPPSHCEEYRALESRAIYALSAPPLDYSPREICAALDWYRVEVVPAESMPCCYAVRDGDHVIRITDDAPATTLPHEIAHVADDLRGIHGHETWAERGVWAAIERAAGSGVAPEQPRCSESRILLTGAAGGSL